MERTVGRFQLGVRNEEPSREPIFVSLRRFYDVEHEREFTGKYTKIPCFFHIIHSQNRKLQLELTHSLLGTRG